MSNFFRNLAEDIKDEDTSIAADGLSSGEYSGTIDTGSYVLNAVLSGSVYGGVPNNKVTAFAGESATGKTFFVLGVATKFLKDNPDAGVVYYDTESAVTKDMIEAFIGSDQNPLDYLQEIANGEYKAEQFIEDIKEYYLGRN